MNDMNAGRPAAPALRAIASRQPCRPTADRRRSTPLRCCRGPQESASQPGAFNRSCAKKYFWLALLAARFISAKFCSVITPSWAEPTSARRGDTGMIMSDDTFGTMNSPDCASRRGERRGVMVYEHLDLQAIELSGGQLPVRPREHVTVLF